MKLYGLVVICALMVAVQAGLVKQQLKELHKIAINACANEVGASEADKETVFAHQPAENMETKCLRTCIMKKINLMNNDGKLNKEIGVKIVDALSDGDAEKMKIAEEIGEACGDIEVSDDHCEAGEEYEMCSYEEAKKRGLNLGED